MNRTLESCDIYFGSVIFVGLEVVTMNLSMMEDGMDVRVSFSNWMIYLGSSSVMSSSGIALM